jgi:hypothetical protein
MLHCSRLVQVEDDLVAIAGGERDASALFEVVAVEMVAGLEARCASLELSFFGCQFGDALLEHALLRLQVDVRHQALTAGDGLRAEIKNGRAQTDAENRGTMFRHRTDPNGGGKMSPSA